MMKLRNVSTILLACILIVVVERSPAQDAANRRASANRTSQYRLRPADVEDLPSRRAFAASPNHPAIDYYSDNGDDAIGRLNRKLRDGSVHLEFEGRSGYLRSVLDALDVPVESQAIVFSKTSLQADRISPKNPRAIYFTDNVVMAFIRGAPLLEFAVHDPTQGVRFYSLDQREVERPRFERHNTCLNCHVTRDSMDVAGMLVRSIVTGPDGRIYPQFGNYVIDHRNPLEERWGGWYVTGTAGGARHMGNAMLMNPENPDSLITDDTLSRTTLAGQFFADGYLTPYSDIAALMVFEHQMHMIDLLIRMGWDVRVAQYESRENGAERRLVKDLLSNDAQELVDYMLFVDEAPLEGAIRPVSGFAEKFSARGPRDKQGRSLRQLDLQRRLMRYPCSYMIYSAAFDALPGPAKDAIYRRMWSILSGKTKDPKYRKLSRVDRDAIVEILRDTKPDLPSYFVASALR